MKNLIYLVLIIAALILTNCASTNMAGNDTFIGSVSSNKTISTSPGRISTPVVKNYEEIDVKQEEAIEEIASDLYEQEASSIVPEEIVPVVPEEVAPVVSEEIESVVSEEIESVVSEEIEPVVSEEIESVVSEEIIPVVSEEIAPVVPEKINPVTEIATPSVVPDKTTTTDFWGRKKTPASDSKKSSKVSKEKAPVVLEEKTTSLVSTPAVSNRSIASNEDIPVYYLNKSLIPENSKSLSKVSVKGSSELGDCDSISVLEQLKYKALEIGGNAIFISKHEKPSLWSTPCHRMEATILDVADFPAQAKIVEPSLDNYKYAKTDDVCLASGNRRFLSKMSLTLEGGAGYWDVKKDGNNDNIHKTLADGLDFGPAWGASLDYFFNDTWGVGLAYSGFTSASKVTERTKSSEKTVDKDYESSVLLTYVGPRLLARAALGGRWVFDAFLGAGYLGYQSPYKVDGKKSTQKETMLGGQLGFHLEYMLSNTVGITGRVSCGMGFPKFAKDNFNQSKKEDLFRSDAMLGLRFHFY